jgi:hypothetical protein
MLIQKNLILSLSWNRNKLRIQSFLLESADPPKSFLANKNQTSTCTQGK